MSKKWLKQETLPFMIMTKPTHKNVVSWFDETGGVNDEQFRLVLSAKGISVWTIVCFLIGILSTIVASIISFFDKSSSFTDWFDVLIPIFVISFFFWLYSFIKRTKRLILDRVTGKMTYPSYGFAPHITLTFKRATVYSTIAPGPDGMIMGTKLQARNPYDRSATRGTYDLAPADPEEWWSYFVWYMDKNRPLPPGKAFDPYRQKDFERRKAEGFPKPLFESNIPTSEATKQQRAERKRIGGW